MDDGDGLADLEHRIGSVGDLGPHMANLAEKIGRPFADALLGQKAYLVEHGLSEEAAELAAIDYYSTMFRVVFPPTAVRDLSLKNPDQPGDAGTNSH